MSEENGNELPKWEDPLKQVNFSQNSTPGVDSVKSGGITMGCGAIFAFFPMIIAMISTAPGSNMWSEGDSNSGGSALWLMMFTFPIGLIMMIVGAGKAKKK